MKLLSLVTFLLSPIIVLPAAQAKSFANCTAPEIEMMLRNAAQVLDTMKFGSSLTMDYQINECRIWGELVRTQKGIVFVLGTNLAGPRQFTKAFNQVSEGVREITNLQKSLSPQANQDQEEREEVGTVPQEVPMAPPSGIWKGSSQNTPRSTVPSVDDAKGEPASTVSPFGHFSPTGG